MALGMDMIMGIRSMMDTVGEAANTKGDQGEMDESRAEVIQLLRLAQSGEPEQALVLADEQLRAAESPGLLYARAVTLHSLGDHVAAVAAAEHMRSVADRLAALACSTSIAGWQCSARSFLAWQQMLVSEADPQAFDLESTLHDLAQAEALLSNDVCDQFVLATAHTSLGNAFHELRLYELALPHFEAAFLAATARTGEVAVERAVASQLNLATMHLNWSMELHRIRDSVGAREKSLIAARHAAMAVDYSTIDDTQPYEAHAALLVACADHGDDNMVVTRIRDALKALEGRGLRESRAYALPFLARALDRAGQHSEALKTAEQAVSALPADATWMVASAAYHTRATLLAASGSDTAGAALAYGDQLAETMWKQRLRTLHNARSMQVLERVTLERDRVRVLANTDALTGVGNRRAFDVRMAELGTARPGSAEVTIIVVDVDRLKAVNDAGGHEAGDRTLQAVASALTSQVRSGDLIARVGGDEFVAVLEGMDRFPAGEMAARIVDAVSAVLGSKVTVSVGVATGQASEAGSSLLRAADRAMYTAKRRTKVVMTGSPPAVADPGLTAVVTSSVTSLSE